MPTISQLRQDPKNRLKGIIDDFLKLKPFDLGNIEEVLASSKGWSQEKIETCRHRYLRFMVLNALLDGVLTPFGSVDVFWDTHFGLSENYRWFCKFILGKDFPIQRNESRGLNAVSIEETSEFYREVFGEPLATPDSSTRRRTERLAQRMTEQRRQVLIDQYR
jgi:hypothetical protein